MAAFIAQRAAVLRYIGAGKLVAEYTEVESGKKHTNRPQFLVALQECRRKKVTLVMAKLDRLGRNVAFISALMESGRLLAGVSLLGYRKREAGMAKVRVGSIVLRVDNLRHQTEFWATALDYIPRDFNSDDFVLLRPKHGNGPNLSLDRHHSVLNIPPRVHLDLYTEDQAEEVRRLLALGATEVHWNKRPSNADYVILADPEGNRFCVVDVSRS